MHRGYIKLWRKIRDNPRLHDPDYLSVWIWCLLEATYSDRKSILGGKEINLKPGQFTTGRRQFSELCGVQESKLERILTCFVNIHQIEQQTTNTNRLISICNWGDYQENKQQVNNNRTTNEQQVNTPKECKKEKKSDIAFVSPSLEEVKQFFFENQYKESLAIRFFNGYNEAGWKDSKGNKIKNWKQKAHHVWFKPEEKIIITNPKRNYCP
jgi:hypothetical protein